MWALCSVFDRVWERNMLSPVRRACNLRILKFRCVQLFFFLIFVSFGGADSNSSTENSKEEENPYPDQYSQYQSTYFCPSERFVNTSLPEVHWKRARPGEYAITDKLCLQPNGLPLMKLCYWGQYQRPEWGNVSSNATECLTMTKEKLVTQTLVNLEDDAFVKNKTRPADAIKQLKRILKTGDYKLIPADIHFTSNIIEEVAERARTPNICVDLLSIYNRLMGADKDMLRASAKLNATNRLLENFERCVDTTSSEMTEAADFLEDQIDGVNFLELGVRAHLAQNLSVFHISPMKANISGIAIYDKPVGQKAPGVFWEEYGNFYYRFLFANETVDGLLSEIGLETASYIPYSLWKSITAKLPNSATLIVKVYSNDALFMVNSLYTSRKVYSKIVSLSIPGVSGKFSEVIPMIFRNKNEANASELHPFTGCAYWTYDTWSDLGITLIKDNSAVNNLIACGTFHMTQFAYLIGGDYRHADYSDSVVISKFHLRALNIITLVGCSLSILGLLGIFVTALVFKSWRSKASSKVLLHLCTAILFQMIIFCFVNTHDMTMYLMENRDYVGCVAVGALLQYSVLVQFTWMLIIAFLQFQRYVQVFGSRPQHFVLKSAIIGWGAPLIPPALLIAIDRRSYIPYYNKDSSMMCYPSGNGMNFGVILPISFIIAANLVIFILVIWNIRHTMEISSKRSEKQKIYQQIRLMVMMFFLFGFTWIFGLLAAIDIGLAFSYLFCITATLQGFVLFVYFVILDPATRKLWARVYCNSEKDVQTSETMRLGTSSQSR